MTAERGEANIFYDQAVDKLTGCYTRGLKDFANKVNGPSSRHSYLQQRHQQFFLHESYGGVLGLVPWLIRSEQKPVNDMRNGVSERAIKDAGVLTMWIMQNAANRHRFSWDKPFAEKCYDARTFEENGVHRPPKTELEDFIIQEGLVTLSADSKSLRGRLQYEPIIDVMAEAKYAHYNDKRAKRLFCRSFDAFIGIGINSIAAQLAQDKVASDFGRQLDTWQGNLDN